MGFAEAFFETMEIARRPTLELVSRLDVSAIAKPWLVMLYQVIRATTPVLERAQQFCDMTEEDGRNLYDYFEAKLGEEMGHDEMLLVDLRSAGIHTAETAPANPFIAEMVGRQYYLVEFAHPAAYLGFIGLLEGFPPTLEQLDVLQRDSGLPPVAFSTARLHAEVDLKHREGLGLVLDVLPKSLWPDVLANGVRCAQLQRLALEILSPTETQWTPDK